MKKTIFSTVLSSLLITILTIFINYFVTIVIGDDIKIEFVSKNTGNTVKNVIMIKNMKNSKDSKKFKIYIDDDVKISNIMINSIDVDVNSNCIIVPSIGPNNVSLVEFNTLNTVRNSQIKLSKNSQKISTNRFNDVVNFTLFYVIVIIIYSLINFVFEIRSKMRTKKHEEQSNKQIKRLEELNNDLTKKVNITLLLHKKEIESLANENKFYKELLLNNVLDSKDKEEIISLVEKRLKSFKKEKIDELSFTDLTEIINEAVRIELFIKGKTQ